MYDKTLCPISLDIDGLTDLSPVPPLPIDMFLLKKHMVLDADRDDELTQFYLYAAIQWAEAAMDRTIVPRAHRWVLKDFPATGDQCIRLPRGKTVKVDSIQYSSGGVMKTLRGPTSNPIGSDYREDLASDRGGIVMPPLSSSWPSCDYENAPAPVILTFTAGYIGSVPEDILHALAFAVSDMYENRATPDTGGRNLDLREQLLPSRLYRMY